MATSEQIKILCVKLNISVSELARSCGTSPQAFIQKMKRETFTPAELKKVAETVGCKFESSFILPDGDRAFLVNLPFLFNNFLILSQYNNRKNNR